MLNDQRAITLTNSTNSSSNLQEDHGNQDDDESPFIRDIHALTPPRRSRGPRLEAWETNSHRSPSLSVGSSATEGGENFTSMSREFSALVLAGSTIGGGDPEMGSRNLGRIGEEENFHEENNPLAIVPDSNPLEPVQSPSGGNSGGGGGDRLGVSTINGHHNGGEVSVERVKKEEVESKIIAWQNAKISKINNRFKREDAVINGWEGEQVQMATSWMKKVEVLNEFAWNSNKKCLYFPFLIKDDMIF